MSFTHIYRTQCVRNGASQLCTFQLEVFYAVRFDTLLLTHSPVITHWPAGVSSQVGPLYKQEMQSSFKASPHKRFTVASLSELIGWCLQRAGGSGLFIESPIDSKVLI